MHPHADLVNSRIIGPCLAVKFSVGGSLFLGYSPVVGPYLSRSNRLSWDPRWCGGRVALSKTSSLAAVIHSLEMK